MLEQQAKIQNMVNPSGSVDFCAKLLRNMKREVESPKPYRVPVQRHQREMGRLVSAYTI